MGELLKIAGVAGWPVSHSLSPRLHNYWLKQLGIHGEYNAYEVRPEALPGFIESLRSMHGMRGCNLTLPHKEHAIALLDSVDALAQTVGAVNTIIAEDGKLHGTNTDVYGFAENIRPHMTGNGKAVILGAGGASRAVAKALLDLGFADIHITNRTRAKAEAVNAALGGVLKIEEWDMRSAVLKGADLLVNTTSLGLKGQPPLQLDLSALPKTALVTDIVYKPLLTPLLEWAQAHGNPTVDGLGMLIYQAVPGFTAWFGAPPDVTAATLPQLKGFLIA